MPLRSRIASLPALALIAVALSAVALLSAAALGAQAPVDPSGHWEGTIHGGPMEVAIEVDLALDARGALAGTFGNPSRGIRGFPLAKVGVEGRTVTFAIPATGGGTFRGEVGGDGRSLQGIFTTQGPDGQPLELPFELTRTGDAVVAAGAKSAAIGKELEGTWAGAIEVDGAVRELRLELTNHADGTATGVLVTGEGAEIPIARIEQAGTSLTLDVETLSGSYAGSLNPDATEIVGTWTQGPFSAPLTFRRSSAS